MSINDCSNKKLITVFYEGGSGGQFLCYLLSNHYMVAPQRFRQDQNNAWINLDFKGKLGDGYEELIESHPFRDDVWNVLGEHASLLNTFVQDNLRKDRSLEDCKKHFNYYYYDIWQTNKTIWINIDDIYTLRKIDYLGAYKNNLVNPFIDYTDAQYQNRLDDLHKRIKIKQQKWSGDFIEISYNELFFSNTYESLKKICNYIPLDKNIIELWMSLIKFYNKCNEKVLWNQ